MNPVRDGDNKLSLQQQQQQCSRPQLQQQQAQQGERTGETVAEPFPLPPMPAGLRVIEGLTADELRRQEIARRMQLEFGDV